MKDLSHLAASVMRTLEQEQLVKQAEVAYTNRHQMTTDIGKSLQKLAERVRIEGSAKITYTDLARFRKTHDV